MEDHPHLLLQTLVTAISVGMLLIVLSDKLKIPSIGLLVVGGIALGPDVIGLIQPESMGDGLQVFVALAVSIIIFEGSISLDFQAMNMTPKAIRGLLSIGPLITWGGCSLLIYFVGGVPLKIAVLTGSLIIVTGPTVIGPLLKKVKVRPSLNHILLWEGVLIEPVGVFIAILCFEWFTYQGTLIEHALSLLTRISVGGFLGLAGGYGIEQTIRRRFVKRDLERVFCLAAAIMLYGISDLISSESGILTVVVAGVWLSYRIPEQIRSIAHFHEEIVRLTVGILFLLLSANLNLQGFTSIGGKGLLTIFLILLLVRPANVFISTITSNKLNLRDKIFLSWLNPRGIVAASMASLFALILEKQNSEYSLFLENFTYLMIITTIIIQGFFTAPVAKFLKVEAEARTDWLIVGSNALSHGLAQFLQRAGQTVSLLDRNINYGLYTETDKFELISDDALSINILQNPRYDRIGFVVGATTNQEFNILVCQKWVEEAIVEEKDAMYFTTASAHQGGLHGGGTALYVKGDSLKVLRDDLVEGNLSLITQQIKDQKEYKIPEEADLLLMRERGQIVKAEKHRLQQAEEVFYLYKHRIPLPQYLHMDLIFPQMNSSDIVIFLMGCVERIAKHYPEIDADTLGGELLKTEPLLTSFIGNQIAVPRVFLPNATEITCSIIQVPEGVAYIPFSNKRATLLFLIVAPESHRSKIKDIVHEIKEIRDNPTLVSNLLKAETTKEIFLLLHQEMGCGDSNVEISTAD